MTLLSLVLTLAIAGFLVWLILQIPMPEPFPKVIIGLVVLFVVLYLLQQFGIVDSGVRLK